MKSTLLLVAAVLLVTGILWRSGVIEPLISSTLKRPVESHSKEMRSNREPGTIEMKPEVATPETKSIVSDDASQTQIKAPIMKSTTQKEPVTVVETPVSKEGTPKPFIATEQDKRNFIPDADVHIEQPMLEMKIPIPESTKDSKEMAGPETSMSQEENPSFPYSILVSHCRSVRSAEEVISQYAKKGLTPYWGKVEVSNGIWYRVFVGFFKDRQEAETFRQDHGLEEGRVMKTAYANLIGVYASSEELRSRIKSLKERGYSPYVTEDQDRESRLYIGAFVTKEGAESQYQELKSRGIESLVTKR